MKKANGPGLLVLYGTTIVVAFCSILYELLLAQTLTVLFGGSVLRYSITIGLYLFSLGVGTLSFSYFKGGALRLFVRTELWLSLIGASAVGFLLMVSVWQFHFPVLVFVFAHLLILLIGFLSGLEIPLLVALAQREHFSQILSVDYLGALVGSVLFGVYLHSHVGLVSTSIWVGIINYLIALYFFHFIEKVGVLRRVGVYFLGGVLFVLLFFHGEIQSEIQMIYPKSTILYDYYKEDKHPGFVKSIDIIDQIQTPFQSIVYAQSVIEEGNALVTDHALFLDNRIQLGDIWMKEYHEAFALSGVAFKQNEDLHFLVLGGGDGFLIQKLLSFENVSQIDHVDIDRVFVEYMRNHSYYRAFNQDAFSSDRVTTYFEDAYMFVKEKAFRNETKKYDHIFVDLSHLKADDKLLHLYSSEFYDFCRKSLIDSGTLSLWGYNKALHLSVLESTLKAAGFRYKSAFCARHESGHTGLQDRCIQRFLTVGTKKKTKQISSDLSFYQEKLFSQVPDIDIPLVSTHRANSVVQPNYDLVVE